MSLLGLFVTIFGSSVGCVFFGNTGILLFIWLYIIYPPTNSKPTPIPIYL